MSKESFSLEGFSGAFRKDVLLAMANMLVENRYQRSEWDVMTALSAIAQDHPDVFTEEVVIKLREGLATQNGRGPTRLFD